MELSGKVALVTGSSRGIGRAIALALAQAGADVAVHYASDQAKAEVVAREINGLGRRTVVVGGDVAQRVAVNQMVAQTQAELGAVDILVNNGAVFLEDVPIWEITEDQWDRIFAVNVRGPLLAMQATVPAMKKNKSGVILNISSLGADVALPGFGAYVSSKGALNSR